MRICACLCVCVCVCDVVWLCVYETMSVSFLCAGMDETGIYRVSGVTSDVQKLKKYFDKSKPLIK